MTNTFMTAPDRSPYTYWDQDDKPDQPLTHDRALSPVEFEVLMDIKEELQNLRWILGGISLFLLATWVLLLIKL